jgi:TRAP transporter TAXI family solute receptor
MSLRAALARHVFVLASLAVASVAGAQQPAGPRPAAAPPTAAKPVPAPAVTRLGDQQWGIAVKRPVVQAACRYCPWGALAEVVKKMMAPYGYDLAICYSCSAQNAVPTVAKRLPSVDVTDRQVGLGVTSPGPPAPMDFGVTSLSGVLNAYNGTAMPEAKALRLLARIEQPSYLMIAVTKESGLTDLKQIRERKMPVRILGGNAAIQEYYGITEKDVRALGGEILSGTVIVKNTNFDVMIGSGVLANYPEGNMWYEMSMMKDLVFLPIPEDVRQKLVKENPLATLVDVPFRYMRGVGDTPLPSVGTSGTAVYARDDIPEPFAYAVAKAIDEHRDLLKWANMPFSYDAKTVGDGAGLPLHPGALRYYRERGYVK